MADFEQLSVHKSADSLSVHKARMARPRLGLPDPEDEDEQDYEDDVPDSPGCDTEVQARVDSIALAQKRLSAEKAGRMDSPKPSKSRFGRVKMAEDSPDSDEKKIGVATGLRQMGRKLAQKLSMGRKETKSVKISQQEPVVHDISADATRVSFAPVPPAVIEVEASAYSEASSFGDKRNV